jgi:hypothetical protein
VRGLLFFLLPWPLLLLPRASEAKEEAVCDAATPEVAPEKFRRKRNRAWAVIGSARYVAGDVLAVPGVAARLEAKLAHGGVNKDLESEDALAYVHDCKGWQPVGRARGDAEGWVRWLLPVMPAGRYRLAVVVPSTGGTARAWLTVLPKGTKLAVLDVDGTLTRHDAELAPDLWADRKEAAVAGQLVAVARPGIRELGAALVGKQLALVYVTGRPYWLAAVTRGWLEQEKMPPGHLILPIRTRQALPGSAVEAFKLARLRELQKAGFQIDWAFGNASSDIGAYESAKIPKARTFIAGKHSGERDTQPAGEGWLEVAARVTAAP